MRNRPRAPGAGRSPVVVPTMGLIATAAVAVAIAVALAGPLASSAHAARPTPEQAAAPGAGGFAAWLGRILDAPATQLLLRRRDLSIEVASLTVPGRAANADPIELADVSIDTGSDGARRRLRVLARLAAYPDAILEATLTLPERGAPDITLSGTGVPLSTLARLAGVQASALQGTATFTARTRIDEGVPGPLTGELTTTAVQWLDGERRVGLGALSGAFRLTTGSDGDAFVVDALRLAPVDGEAISDLSVRATPDRITARTRRIPVAGLAGLARALLPPGEMPLSAVSGQLEDVEIELDRRAADLGGLTLRARVRELAVEALPGGIALRDAAGRLAFDHGEGVLDIERAAVALGPRPAYPEGLSAWVDGGRVRLHRAGDGRPVASVDRLALTLGELDMRARGHVGWAGGEAEPEIDLRFDIEREPAENLLGLLPRGIMPEGLLHWFERAEASGRIESGWIRLTGRPSEIPTAEDGRGISARLTVTGASLNYARGWPGVTGASARLAFAGRALRIDVDGGEVHGARIVEGRATVADVLANKPTVVVTGRAEGTSEGGARFLRDSPLAPRFGHFLDQVSFRGQSRLDIDLELPLRKSRGGTRRVRGALTVRANEVDLPGLADGLHRTSGVFRFDGRTVTASKVEATYLGRPIQVAAEPFEEGEGTRVRITGEATPEYLTRHLHNTGLVDHPDTAAYPLLGRLDGGAQWRAVVEIPHVRERGRPVVEVRVESDLVGARLDLPEPLAKAAATPLDLSIRTTFHAGGTRVLDLRYGRLAAARFILAPRTGGHHIERGAVQLGGDRAVLSEHPGVYVRGHLPSLAAGPWYRLFKSGSPRARDTRTSGSAPRATGLDRLRSVDLTIGDLEVLGTHFHDTRVEASRVAGEVWRAVLTGAGVHGEARIPPDLTARPIDIHFERLVFPPLASRANRPPPAPIDPRDLPAFRFDCGRCAYGDHDLGSIRIAAEPAPDGFRFARIDVDNAAYRVRSNGTWLLVGGRHRSRFEARLHSDDLESLTSAFGYSGGAAVGGATDMAVTASWSAPLADLDLTAIDATVQFRSRDGRLPDIQPGATGRLFGLLMLPALPRRLALDFADVFETGLEYDQIEGSFHIEGGHAYTNDLELDGQTARIEVAGRTGIVTEDYDHVVTVTPKISSTLPLAPVWLAEKLLNQQIFDRVFAYRYTVTGPWSAPVVTPVVEETDDDAGPTEQPTG